VKGENMSKIEIDLDELVLSFGFDDEELAKEYFDRETGNIINIPRSVMKALEGDMEEEELDDWEKELLEDAEAVLEDMEDRYLVIPNIESDYFYRAMQSFAEEVQDNDIKNELLKALNSLNPMRQFKNAISNHMEVQNLWYDYEDNKAKEYVIEWLEKNKIEFKEV
jgi:hypothetical protein